MQTHYINKFIAVLAFSFFGTVTTTPLEVMTDTTAQLIKKSQKPTVVFIYANYCGACNKAKEDLPDIEKECGKKVSFYQCNIQDNFGMGFLKNNAIVTQDIHSIPVFIIRSKGKVAHFQMGYPGKENLVNMIKKYS